jgi:hypothetical protein
MNPRVRTISSGSITGAEPAVGQPCELGGVECGRACRDAPDAASACCCALEDDPSELHEAVCRDVETAYAPNGVVALLDVHELPTPVMDAAKCAAASSNTSFVPQLDSGSDEHSEAPSLIGRRAEQVVSVVVSCAAGFT